MRRVYTTLFFAFISILSFSQDIPYRTCGYVDAMKRVYMANPNFEEESKALFGLVKNSPNQRLQNTDDTTYTVQVVVHVVYLEDNKYENVPDAIIQSQIDALNRDFNLQNADSSNLRSYFEQFRGNAKIKFQLATKAPGGAPTTGITRTKGKLGSLNGWDPINTIIWTALGVEPLKEDNFVLTNSKGKSSWGVGKYLNIWVCDLNYASRKCPTCLNLCDTCGALGGFAYPPANIPHWEQVLIIGGDTIRQNSALPRGEYDGIVIDFRFFGINNWYAQDSMSARGRARYGNGRSTVHEMGHYLGLRHTWGDAIALDSIQLTPDGCYLDDYIDDTPNSIAAFANVLSDPINNPCDTSINTCDDPYLGIDYPDMFENYMDYSTDMCYNLFTQQQIDFMRLILTTKRPGIIVKREVESVPTGIRHQTANHFQLYPNPANNLVTITNAYKANKKVQVEVLDMTGRILKQTQFNAGQQQLQVDISNLEKAMYVIRFSNDEFVTSERVIKQ